MVHTAVSVPTPDSENPNLTTLVPEEHPGDTPKNGPDPSTSPGGLGGGPSLTKKRSVNAPTRKNISIPFPHGSEFLGPKTGITGGPQTFLERPGGAGIDLTSAASPATASGAVSVPPIAASPVTSDPTVSAPTSGSSPTTPVPAPAPKNGPAP